MKKAYIITFYNELNYGAVLQSFAVFNTLKKYGYSPCFLGVTLSNFSNSLFYKKIMYEIMNFKKRLIFNDFIKKEFQVEYKECNYKLLLSKKVNCELLVCGSDQIWNPNIVGNGLEYYFGKGIDAKIKISYAASCGATNTIMDKIQLIKELLRDFSAISIREKSTTEYLQKNDINCSHVVDPTLLIDKNKWIYLKSKSHICLKKKYIFVYDIDPKEAFVDVVKKYSAMEKLEVVSLRRKKHYGNDNTRYPFASPYDFINLLYGAELVITNSYHAMLFSYIFSKRAIVVPHSKYFERMRDFLENIGVNINGEFLDLNFSKVSREGINKHISDSYKFLNNSIGE